MIKNERIYIIINLEALGTPVSLIVTNILAFLKSMEIAIEKLK
jgi:hypothetical protein